MARTRNAQNVGLAEDAAAHPALTAWRAVLAGCGILTDRQLRRQEQLFLEWIKRQRAPLASITEAWALYAQRPDVPTRERQEAKRRARFEKAHRRYRIKFLKRPARRGGNTIVLYSGTGSRVLDFRFCDDVDCFFAGMTARGEAYSVRGWQLPTGARWDAMVAERLAWIAEDAAKAAASPVAA